VTYYGRQLGHENLFVIDHGSEDLSARTIRACTAVNVLRVPRGLHDDGQRSRAVSALHESLLQYFDAGFATDCDEFLVVDPARFDGLRGLAAAVRQAGGTGATALGLNLVHMPDLEPAYRAHVPIMMQRRHLRFELSMCKTSFAAAKIRWSGGFHASTLEPRFVEGFYLFHLKLFDHDWRLTRQGISRGWPWSGSHGGHSRGPDSDVERRFDQAVKRRIAREPVASFDFTRQIERLNAIIRRTPGGIYVFDKPTEAIDDDMRLAPEWTRLLF
jgi:hypothetical protein